MFPAVKLEENDKRSKIPVSIPQLHIARTRNYPTKSISKRYKQKLQLVHPKDVKSKLIDNQSGSSKIPILKKKRIYGPNRNQNKKHFEDFVNSANKSNKLKYGLQKQIDSIENVALSDIEELSESSFSIESIDSSHNWLQNIDLPNINTISPNTDSKKSLDIPEVLNASTTQNVPQYLNLKTTFLQKRFKEAQKENFINSQSSLKSDRNSYYSVIKPPSDLMLYTVNTLYSRDSLESNKNYIEDNIDYRRLPSQYYTTSKINIKDGQAQRFVAFHNYENDTYEANSATRINSRTKLKNTLKSLFRKRNKSKTSVSIENQDNMSTHDEPDFNRSNYKLYDCFSDIVEENDDIGQQDNRSPSFFVSEVSNGSDKSVKKTSINSMPLIYDSSSPLNLSYSSNQSSPSTLRAASPYESFDKELPDDCQTACENINNDKEAATKELDSTMLNLLNMYSESFNENSFILSSTTTLNSSNYDSIKSSKSSNRDTLKSSNHDTLNSLNYETPQSSNHVTLKPSKYDTLTTSNRDNYGRKRCLVDRLYPKYFGPSIDESFLLMVEEMKKYIKIKNNSIENPESPNIRNKNNSKSLVSKEYSNSKPKWMSSLPNSLYLEKWINKEYKKLKTDINQSESNASCITQGGTCAKNKSFILRRTILDSVTQLLKQKQNLDKGNEICAQNCPIILKNKKQTSDGSFDNRTSYQSIQSCPSYGSNPSNNSSKINDCKCKKVVMNENNIGIKASNEKKSSKGCCPSKENKQSKVKNKKAKKEKKEIEKDTSQSGSKIPVSSQNKVDVLHEIQNNESKLENKYYLLLKKLKTEISPLAASTENLFRKFKSLNKLLSSKKEFVTVKRSSKFKTDFQRNDYYINLCSDFINYDSSFNQYPNNAIIAHFKTIHVKVNQHTSSQTLPPDDTNSQLSNEYLPKSTGDTNHTNTLQEISKKSKTQAEIRPLRIDYLSNQQRENYNSSNADFSLVLPPAQNKHDKRKRCKSKARLIPSKIQPAPSRILKSHPKVIEQSTANLSNSLGSPLVLSYAHNKNHKYDSENDYCSKSQVRTKYIMPFSDEREIKSEDLSFELHNNKRHFGRNVEFDPETKEPNSYIKRVRSGTNGRLLKLRALMSSNISEEKKSINNFKRNFFKSQQSLDRFDQLLQKALNQSHQIADKSYHHLNVEEYEKDISVPNLDVLCTGNDVLNQPINNKTHQQEKPILPVTQVQAFKLCRSKCCSKEKVKKESKKHKSSKRNKSKDSFETEESDYYIKTDTSEASIKKKKRKGSVKEKKSKCCVKKTKSKDSSQNTKSNESVKEIKSKKKDKKKKSKDKISSGCQTVKNTEEKSCSKPEKYDEIDISVEFSDVEEETCCNQQPFESSSYEQAAPKKLKFKECGKRSKKSKKKRKESDDFIDSKPEKIQTVRRNCFQRNQSPSCVDCTPPCITEYILHESYSGTTVNSISVPNMTCENDRKWNIVMEMADDGIQHIKRKVNALFSRFSKNKGDVKSIKYFPAKVFEYNEFTMIEIVKPAGACVVAESCPCTIPKVVFKVYKNKTKKCDCSSFC